MAMRIFLSPLVFWTHSTRPHSSFNGTTACKYEHQMKIITSRPFLVWFTKEARWTTVSILDGSELYRYWPTIVATTLKHCTRNGEISRLRVEHRRVEIIGIICSIPFPAPPPPPPPPSCHHSMAKCTKLQWVCPIKVATGKATGEVHPSHTHVALLIWSVPPTLTFWANTVFWQSVTHICTNVKLPVPWFRVFPQTLW